MTLVLSLLVIVAVAALVGRVAGRSRPGERHSSTGAAWPSADIDRTDGVDLTDGSVPHHGDFAGHSHGHDGGGWGGDSGGFSRGDSGGGGGGGD